MNRFLKSDTNRYTFYRKCQPSLAGTARHRKPKTSYGLQKRTSILYTFSRNGVQHMWPSSDEFIALFANRFAENDVNSLYVLQKRKRRPPCRHSGSATMPTCMCKMTNHAHEGISAKRIATRGRAWRAPQDTANPIPHTCCRKGRQFSIRVREMVYTICTSYAFPQNV